MSNKAVSTAFPLTGITFLVFLVLKFVKSSTGCGGGSQRRFGVVLR